MTGRTARQAWSVATRDGTRLDENRGVVVENSSSPSVQIVTDSAA